MLTAALQAVTSLATVILAAAGDQHRKASGILKNTQTKEQHMRKPVLTFLLLAYYLEL